ncbi:MAG TPA: coproporphyrinogen-III oxidase family protein [Coriobacteriia bacterium]|nr:coproporphyrinogen-III oxidase family protein [Coriobacteriia bacterium]
MTDAGPTLPRHLYVHVPLCRAKCAYCDFFSLTPDEIAASPDAIVDALVNQTRAWAERGLEPAGLDTLYVGGGTPTMLGDGLATLVSALAIWAGVGPDAEITIEANPESLSRSLVELLAMAGVTRVSLGVQSFDDGELALLGRLHDARRAQEAARWVAEAGLQLAVDIMCGLPGQPMTSWRETLVRAVETGAGHVSVYPLSLEGGTPLAAAVLIGDVPEPDDDLVADMLLEAENLLGEAGLARYEVANYARPGLESRHNTAYWTGAEYVGVGPGAHGMLDARTARTAGFVVPAEAARVRYSVACEIPGGLTIMPRVDVESLVAAEAAREDAMLGLRMIRGIDDALAAQAGVTGVLAELARDGLVTHEAGRWSTTPRGWLLGNEVFGRVWAGE